MYQIEVAGDDIKRLNKILAWTGSPGAKHPEHVHFVSNEKGIFLWVNNPFCQAVFKIHGPMGDYGIRKLFWGEWKRGFGKVKKDTAVKIKVKKTEVETQMGTVKAKLYAHPSEDEPTFDVMDASEITGDKVYFNDDAMAVSKIALSAKTTVASLAPLFFHGEFLTASSVFFTKAATMVMPFEGDGCYTQGFLRIPVEAGGGVSGFTKDEELWLSAIDFTCRFTRFPMKESRADLMLFMGSGDRSFVLGFFPDFDKKTEGNAYIRAINALKPGDKPVSARSLTVSPGKHDNTVEVHGLISAITVVKADLVAALKNMSTERRAKVLVEGDKHKALVLTDSNKDKVVTLAGIRV